MGEYKVLIEQRKSLKGEISVPGDKSISHRAIMFGSLAKGTTEIDGIVMNEDCLSTLECFRKMQIGIDILPKNKVKVHGKGLFGLTQPPSPLNTGRSGTTIRLLLGVLSGQPFNSILNRAESVQKKPMGKVVKPLLQMGASIKGKDDGNFCPISVSPARLSGATHQLSLLDTYVKSPVLIAGLYANGETSVIEAVKSRDHTELMLGNFGADIKVDGLKVSSCRTDNLTAQHVVVPGDISIASYFMTAALLAPDSDITIKDVGINPTRTGILDVYKSMGAKIEILNERTVSNEKVADIRILSSALNSITIEGDIIPRLIDEIPVIAVAAAAAQGTTTIKGLRGFKVKESGRLKYLAIELSKMGANVRETIDGIVIEGGKALRGTVVDSYNDYMITMSLAVAGLIADGETMIRKSQAVDVAFPEFFNVLNKL